MKRVVFRADGNSQIGYGHFIRSLGLAALINKEFNCVYATQTPTVYQLNEIKKICNHVIELSDSDKHYEEFLNFLNVGDIVVLDNYFFNSEYQIKIRKRGCKLIYIDDHNDKDYVCDVLINNIPGFPYESFKKEDYTKLCLGTDYALLREDFFNPKYRIIKKKPHTIFMSFGGADFFNISEKIMTFLEEMNLFSEIHLLIGDAYRFFPSLEKFHNLKIHKNINANEVATLIATSDICIVPASSLLNEAASIGSKILLGFFAENQVQPYNYFVDNDLAIGVGDYRTLNFNLFKEKVEEVIKSSFLIENQKKVYTYQQCTNLKKVFYDL
ncbi:UDP-2,4-diacetamido-2,4,6-trideoxy-beta-L-altropyranose hydrolase [Flavobacterium pectinovorum]|uniref:UDP-2,4-diacetamido-2,4, 6-trideoxy-beta-L-altropyranose hydrolase n=1 Tax=Flavobacterium pectinovorum TaxID=29533 RepID=A0A502EQJ7_9FLAO|nr:UDP-2,4-diacetamido-2,4,6-trideoxy-beta-L-altropyranose hydrolase [Flavobacterium pectinovorum]TPG40085.1 UDP-2,4-diacetamido-2,4,6-trideoxy-beta-L-altropyranose hydrolase [Flavobacterium pectinovorum]